MYRDWGAIAAPLSTADWFWRFPWEIGQSWLYGILNLAKYQSSAWLYWNASPEFNNSSGIFMPFIDYGATGGLIFWAIFGAMTGQIFRSFVAGGIIGMLIYPSWFIGLLEMPRILYLCEARYFPVLIICLAVVFLIGMIAEQEAKGIARRPLP